jgi:hypothetical protein
MEKITVYLAGGIKKGDEKKVCWGEEEKDNFRKVIEREMVFLDPQKRKDDINDSFSRFGRDMVCVDAADFFILDAREKRGLGVGVEMVVAKMKGIPIISIVPRNSHYRRESVEILGQIREDWIHPFVFSLSDVIVDNFEEAGKWVKEFLDKPKKVKDVSVIEDSMRSYKEKQMHKDILEVE